MATHIELDVIKDGDPYESTYKKLFSKHLMTEISGDDRGHVWFMYEGKEVSVKADYEVIKNQLIN